MSGSPPYPKTDEPSDERGTRRRVSPRLAALVIVAIVVIVVLHLTGAVGPGAH